jgi:hypothetical protein
MKTMSGSSLLAVVCWKAHVSLMLFVYVCAQELCSPRFEVRSMVLISSLFCVVFIVVLFAFVLCLVCPVLPVFPDCQFCIALSVFYYIVYLIKSAIRQSNVFYYVITGEMRLID